MDEVKTILVYRPGCIVKLPNGNRGVVVAMSYDGVVTYKVSWWAGDQRYEQWLHPNEMEPCAEPPRIPISFHP